MLDLGFTSRGGARRDDGATRCHTAANGRTRRRRKALDSERGPPWKRAAPPGDRTPLGWRPSQGGGRHDHDANPAARLAAKRVARLLGSRRTRTGEINSRADELQSSPAGRFAVHLLRGQREGPKAMNVAKLTRPVSMDMMCHYQTLPSLPIFGLHRRRERRAENVIGRISDSILEANRTRASTPRRPIRAIADGRTIGK